MERAPQTLVLDASVVAKWFIAEEYTDKALLIRRSYIERTLDLIAPDLLLYETVNVMAEYPGMNRKNLEENIRSLFSLELDFVAPSSDLLVKIASNARELRISTYDSSYLSMADYMGTYVVTADEELHRRTKRVKRTLLLSELGKTWNLP